MSLISYFGGKNRQSQWMYNYIPTDCKNYVEVFGGSMAFFFKEDFSKFDLIVYNDINPYLVNMFSCFKNDFDRLKQLIVNTDMSLMNSKFKHEFKKKYIDNFIPIVGCDYHLACDFLKFFAFQFSAMMNDTGFVYKTGIRGFNAYINKLNNPNHTFHKVKNINHFENLDFKQLIQKYDSPETFFYIDPPYKNNYNNKTNSNKYATTKYFGEYSHKELFEVLDKIKGKFMLSYYMFDELKDLYKPPKYRFFSKLYKLNCSNNKGVKPLNEEILILNYEHRKKLIIKKNSLII